MEFKIFCVGATLVVAPNNRVGYKTYPYRSQGKINIVGARCTCPIISGHMQYAPTN